MLPLNLKIENFASHENTEIDFNLFTSAIVIGKLNGNDKFSNGTGKSTIFSAIKYVIYNEIDFSTMQKIIRHGCERASVCFDFLSYTDNNIYRIVRSRTKKISDVRLYRKNSDSWEDLTQRRAIDTEKEIQKIIKINYKTFCNSVLFTQGEAFGIAALTPEKRKLALKEAINISIYSKFELAAKKKANDLQKEIDKIKTIISVLGNPEKEISLIKEELDKQEALHKDKVSEIEKIRLDILEKENFRNSIKIDLSNKDFQLENLNDSKNKILCEIKKIENDIAKISALRAKEKDEGLEIQNKIKSLKKFISANDKSNLNSKLESLNTNSAKLNKVISEKSVLLKSLEIKLNDMMIPLPQGGNCKHCRQTLSEEHRKICQQSIDNDVKNIKNEILDIKNNIKSLTLEFNSISNNLNITNDLFKKVENSNKELEFCDRILKEKINKFNDYENYLNSEVERLDNRKKELDDLNKININDLSKLNNELKKIDNDLSVLKSRFDVYTNLENKINNEKLILNHRLVENENNVVKLNLLNDNLNNLNKELIIHNKVIQAFSSSGIPALITMTVLDDLQIESNKFLSEIRPGLQLKFIIEKDKTNGDRDDTLDIVYFIGGNELEYQQLSGAQKLIVSVALRLGLSEVIRKRLGVDIKMLLIDEVDQSLDEAGLDALEDVIKKLQSSYKILVITHNNNFKDKFNKAILVEQNENLVSNARIVNSW